MESSQLLIKVCGLKESENIQAVDELGVDYIGMIFYEKSKRYIREVPLNISLINAKKVGVFVNASLGEIEQQIKLYELDVIQLHGQESPDFCKEVQKLNVTVWKVFGVGDNFDFNAVKPYKAFVDLFLFDTQSKQHGGTGIKFNWNLLNELPSDTYFLLSGGISMEDSSIIKSLQLKGLVGVDLNSKFEIEPGIKDVKKLNEFITALKSH